MKIIFVCRYVDLEKLPDPIAVKALSKKIGIISHYLSDYVCYPHANRWTFFGTMKKHIKYESLLNDYAKTHDFKKSVIQADDIDIYDGNLISFRSKIKNYINDVIQEYDAKVSFANDLDFALSLNLKISYFIIDTIREYTEELHPHFVYEL